MKICIYILKVIRKPSKTMSSVLEDLEIQTPELLSPDAMAWPLVPPVRGIRELRSAMWAQATSAEGLRSGLEAQPT